jgi:hypothetical protein
MKRARKFHVITDVDEFSNPLRGTCSKCGSNVLVTMWWSKVEQRTFYRCRQPQDSASRAYRERRRAAGIPPGVEAYRMFLKSSCERCSFVPEDTCQLDIHHQDGNHENDDPKNLQTLCANCHRLVHVRARRIKSQIGTGQSVATRGRLRPTPA